MVDVHSPEQRSFNMSRIKGKDTKPEILLRSLLHRAGFRFRKNFGHLPGKPDIVLPKYKTAIFVHGCFWHRHANCRFAACPSSNKEFWQRKFLGTVERDTATRRSLEQSGWSVLTVWECELKQNPLTALNKICVDLQGKRFETAGPAAESLRPI
ncbi:very short patch repair endonuclease [Asticcacaulis biprosthecium]|uniref:very short patch repair endonuclease n=1 Tax=Asticcacaulis biprosthecium TaxID=76891 RepID=UPI000A04DD0D|nr:very short patch repair endonuclease [Asticcacaulis biprosthecium]